MELHLKQKRREAKERVRRFNRRCQILTSLLCRARGEYLDAKDEFESLDREIAEQHIQYVQAKAETKTKGSGKVNRSSINLDDLTTDQIAMLKARLEQEYGEEEMEDD